MRAGRDAAPAGEARNLAPGRPRDPARAAPRPLCEELAGLARVRGQGECGFKKRGPGLMAGPT
jgi:hypothetical protein